MRDHLYLGGDGGEPFKCVGSMKADSEQEEPLRGVLLLEQLVGDS